MIRLLSSKLLINGFSYECIQRLLMLQRIDGSALVEIAADPDIKAAFICHFRFSSFFSAHCKIIIDGAVKDFNEL